MATVTPARSVDPPEAAPAGAPRLPGILLGIGLGGFVDGIVLHQILQWHHMLSSEGDYSTTTVAGLEANTLADGLFHAATWIAVAVAVWLLWRRADEWRWAASGRALLGWILAGWGLFNVVEGLVDHELLGLHHVREDTTHPVAWDMGFLAFGVLLALGGCCWRGTTRVADGSPGRQLHRVRLGGDARRTGIVGWLDRARARRELAVPIHAHERELPVVRHPLRYDHERAGFRTCCATRASTEHSQPWR